MSVLKGTMHLNGTTTSKEPFNHTEAKMFLNKSFHI